MEHANAQRHISNRLRKYREIAGLTQKEVAAKMGLIGWGRISLWESGQSTPGFDNLFLLSIIYKTPIDELYFGHRETLINELKDRTENMG